MNNNIIEFSKKNKFISQIDYDKVEKYCKSYGVSYEYILGWIVDYINRTSSRELGSCQDFWSAVTNEVERVSQGQNEVNDGVICNFLDDSGTCLVDGQDCDQMSSQVRVSKDEDTGSNSPDLTSISRELSRNGLTKFCSKYGISHDDLIDCLINYISHFNHPDQLTSSDLWKFLTNRVSQLLSCEVSNLSASNRDAKNYQSDNNKSYQVEYQSEEGLTDDLPSGGDSETRKSSRPRAVIFATHPDDDILGLGYEFYDILKKYDTTIIISITSTFFGTRAGKLVRSSEGCKAVEEVKQIYSEVSGSPVEILILNEETNRVANITSSNYNDLIPRIDKILDQLDPSLIMFPNDAINIGHHYYHKLVKVVTRGYTISRRNHSCKVVEYEYPGSTFEGKSDGYEYKVGYITEEIIDFIMRVFQVYDRYGLTNPTSIWSYQSLEIINSLRLQELGIIDTSMYACKHRVSFQYLLNE